MGPSRHERDLSLELPLRKPMPGFPSGCSKESVCPGSWRTEPSPRTERFAAFFAFVHSRHSRPKSLEPVAFRISRHRAQLKNFSRIVSIPRVLVRRESRAKVESLSRTDHTELEDIMGTTLTIGASTTKSRTINAHSAKSITRYLPAVGRIVIGVPYVIVGLNGLLNFLPQPTTPMSAGAMAFAGALASTGYMLQLIAVTQLVVGALLVSNRFVPLALALIAPFTVNSIAFHTFLEHSGLPFAIVFLAIELALVRVYWPAYRPMLTARVARAAK
jgi:hypothetical protein